MPPNPKNFNVDNVRVVKIMGGSLAGSQVVRGMVFGRQPEGACVLLSRNIRSKCYPGMVTKVKKTTGRAILPAIDLKMM